MTKTRKSWYDMLNRCRNPKCIDYRHYGARGIRVCERWQSFENFLADMGEKPEGRTIDRIDNSRDYEPGNCRWANHYQQMANCRQVRRITFNGLSLMLCEWADRLGISHSTLGKRLKTWKLEEALTTGRLPHRRLKRRNDAQRNAV